MRYNYFTNNENLVVCESKFAGKKVTAVAKCSEEDSFNLAYGMLLARARVDEKIARKRCKKARERVNAAGNAYVRAMNEWDTSMEYLTAAMKEVEKTKENLAYISSNTAENIKFK